MYASLFISLFLFLPFFLLPHWLFSLPPFFFPSSSPSPPPPLSFFIRPFLALIRLLNALSPHRPLDGSHFPFRSPLFPPIIFFSPLSSLLFDIPILIFFPRHYRHFPRPPTLALSLGPITPFVFPFFPSNRHPSSPFSPFRLLLSPPPSSASFALQMGHITPFVLAPLPSNHGPPSPPLLHLCLSLSHPSSSSLCPILSSRRNWGCIASFIFSSPSLCPHATLPFYFPPNLVFAPR